jgi:Xaa-Pro aminopeptidase
VDNAAREVLVAAGLGEAFIHRTGHGIGMETHEEPYIVAGNSSLLELGHAFSIEPGFYFEGQYGARIEDIVTCTTNGILSANNTSRDLVIL